MNHTAREHAWAQAARRTRRTATTTVVFPDRTMPDRYEATLPEVFPELAPAASPGSPSSTAGSGRRSTGIQWDLNYANPDVFVEMFRVMVDLANLGVEVLRLDAVAFTWKRLGTNCQNQPEAHLSRRRTARCWRSWPPPCS